LVFSGCPRGTRQHGDARIDIEPRLPLVDGCLIAPLRPAHLLAVAVGSRRSLDRIRRAASRGNFPHAHGNCFEMLKDKWIPEPLAVLHVHTF
jgi:hypothetical protein